MCLPNFIIIGAEKAGTTALWQFLRQHPQVYMSAVKEPQFFGYEGREVSFQGPGPVVKEALPICDLEEYKSLFKGTESYKAVGEASPSYLYNSQAPERIRHYVPQAKLIAILRNPVDRAYSRFLHLVREDREPAGDFLEALEKEPWRIQNNWWPDFFYKQNGFYYAQLSRYYDLFDEGQIKVYLYEDLSADPLKTLQDIFAFLDVDVAFEPDTSLKPNVSGVPKSRNLHLFLNSLRRARPLAEAVLPEAATRRILKGAHAVKNNNLAKPKLSAPARQQLVEVFREDILNLQGLVNRDLSKWLTA